MPRALIPLALLAAGCGASGGSATDGAPTDHAAPIDLASAAADAGGDLANPIATDGGGGCPRLPGDADRPRKVVVSHPFDGQGGNGTQFEVLDLTADGTLTRPMVTFAMGTANEHPIRFTPDGAVGLVAQDDGSVGVFRFDDGGAPQVVHAAFGMGFYASDVVVSGDGTRAFVLDADTAENGGGVYEVAIGCDGTLTARGKVVPGNAPNAMEWLPGVPSRALLAAPQALGSPMGTDTHIIDFAGAMPNLVASGAAFPDSDAIPSSAAVMPDGKYALISDNGILAGNRIAVVSLPDLTAAQLIATPNPAQVVASPFGDLALILNSDGKDALRIAKYDPNQKSPFTVIGELAYVNGKPQLPSAAVVISRGRLKGLVLVAELSSVREVQFDGNGGAKDTARLDFGGGNAAIVGSVGVQP